MNRASKCFVAVVILAFVSYVAAVVTQVQLWAEISAPVFDLFATGTIFYTIFTSKNKMFRLHFILIGAAVAVWAVGDTLWLVYTFVLHINPIGNMLINSFYMATNLCFVAAMVCYACNRLQKWNSVQLIIDSVSFSLAILWMLWAVLYGKHFSARIQPQSSSFWDTFSIALDLFMVVVICIWYLSIRKGKIPLFLKTLVSSIVVYAIVDLVYLDRYIQNLYMPDTLLDAGYLAVLLCLTISVALFFAKYPVAYENPNANTNIGYNHKGLLVLLCPGVILLLNGLDIYDVVFYLLLILFHEYASAYIQRTISDKARLNQDLDMNKQLEKLVSDQTQDLKSINTELRRRNTELQYINYHDSMTGLYNRVYFFAHLDELLQECTANESIVLMIWNIDKLKSVNDTYGYSMGDKLLKWHARQVKAGFADNGVVARLGSDEFAYAIKGAYTDDDLFHIAQHVLDACQSPLYVDEYVLNITVSAGVSMFPQCASDAASLLKNADIAMHHAKSDPSDRHIARYMDIDEAVKRKFLIAKHLKTARFDQELLLNFQPQFRIWDRVLIGMEALLRWSCPEIGDVAPSEFIPIAEEENMIIPIGNWVMNHAIQQIARWNTAYHTDLRMGINISPKQLDQAGTMEELRKSIAEYQAHPRWIDIEITENVALDNEDSAEKIKSHFQNKGISVSIDDFGTGYSSLGYLSILSFDRLKIAKPLIDKITFDESSRKIVMSIVLLAKSLGLMTISEGVETKEQFDLLRELGCDQIQGYYLGRPVPAAEFETTYLQPYLQKHGKDHPEDKP